MRTHRNISRRTLTAGAVITTAALSVGLVPVAAQAAPVPAALTRPAVVHPMSGNGWVSQGNLRTGATQDPGDANIIVTIYNQWVNFTCWIDGGYNGFNSNRWFKANYYGHIGYMSSGVVTSQPSLPPC